MDDANDDGYCPICLEAIDDSEVTVLPRCGHKMHTSCALHSAWKGMVSCPVCRQLPIDVGPFEVGDNQAYSIHMHNKTEMLKACTKGMRKANTPQASKVLKTAVEKLRSLMEKHANKVKERKYFKDVQKLMMSEIDVAVTKIKEKYKNRETKKGHDGARLVKGMRVNTKFSCWHQTRYSMSSINILKKRVAQANGWVPVDRL